MKKLFLLFLIITICEISHGQNYLGVNTSNYAGVMGNDINPASFVDGRFSFDLNLFSTNLNVYQNFGFVDTKYMRELQNNSLGRTYWWIKSFTDTSIFNQWGDAAFQEFNLEPFSEGIIKHLYDTLTESHRGINVNFQFDLLNFAFHLTPKIAVGFNAKARSILNVDNMDSKLAVLAESGLDTSDLWGRKLPEELLNLNHMTWTEYGLNYSQVLYDKDQHFLKVGGDVKYMQGYTAAYVYTDNFNYGLVDEDTSFFLQGDFAYGYSDNFDKLLDGNIETGMFGLPKPSSKSGYGFDLGAVYEWRPNFKKYKFDMDGKSNLWMRNQNKYELRVGASILDIGALRFSKGGLSRDFSVDVQRHFDLNQFETATSLQGFDEIIDSLIFQSINPAEWTQGEKDTSSVFWVQTPSAFSLQVDYHIWKYFYVNATTMLNLISKKRAAKVKVANQVSITPSFDYAWFGLHLPISYNEYSGFKSGLGARLGPLTVGLTDFRTLFAKGKVRGIDFYAGIRVPVLYDPIKDIDGDGVSDKNDDCITEPGIWAFKGCPDTDGDGIQDSEDECKDEPGPMDLKGCPDRDGDKIVDKKDDCPDDPGLKEFNGCPDRDGDKIMDKEDDCPDEPGLKEFNGCPDKDGDGIPDKDDDCPEIAGPKEYTGCPDTDNDGIRDIDDACPSDSGSVEFQGCPDTDLDGLFDFVDDCPEIAGPKENNGCPWPDTDGDGLLDKDDDCPNTPGPKANKGCPYKDTDGDGLFDKDDDCPNTPGPIDNKGCPVVEDSIVDVLTKAFDNLEFETAKDIIKDVSKESLDELADVLTNKPTWKLEISGHTDNVGEENANMVLSKKRAEALKTYLMDKGIEEERLIVFYFGESKPIADNSTAEGRQKNRRVEMKIVFD